MSNDNSNININIDASSSEPPPASVEATSKYPDLLRWIFQQCVPDVARYIMRFVDFSTIINGLQEAHPSVNIAVLKLLKEKWWRREANVRWEGYFSDGLLEYIYNNSDELSGAQNFRYTTYFKYLKARPIYTVIAVCQQKIDSYRDVNAKYALRLLQENPNIAQSDLYALPSHLIPKFEVPSFLCKYLSLLCWSGLTPSSKAESSVPWCFLFDPEDCKFYLDTEDIEGEFDWDEGDYPNAPHHPYLLWVFHASLPESNILGYYTGPVFVYEDEWNKSWGILVEDADQDNKTLAEERKQHGSSRIRKFYWPDPNYFPVIRYALHGHDLYLDTSVSAKSCEKIVEILQKTPQEIRKIFNKAIDDFFFDFPPEIDDKVKKILYFPWHWLRDGTFKSIHIDATDKFHKYTPNYSKYWMRKVTLQLRREIVFDSD